MAILFPQKPGFDGHDFIPEAVNAGVGALLVSQPVNDAERVRCRSYFPA